MIRVPIERPPTHPGEMLLKEFLLPMSMTNRELAFAIGVSEQVIDNVIDQKQGMMPAIALRLAKYFGTSIEFWLHLQLRWDIYQACINESLDDIQPRKIAS